MINMSDLLTSIKMSLGIYGFKLPFDEPDKTLANVIRLKSLKTYEQFFPNVKTVSFDLVNDLKCLKDEYTESIYEIPDVYGTHIIYIRNVFPKNKLLGNGFIAPVFDGTIDTYNSLMMVQATADLASVAAPPITFKFEEPNRMYLYNMATAYGEVEVELAMGHSESLSTIPASQWESFSELATIDVKMFLYNIMKQYNEIQTAYGNINFHIDDWQNAENDRKELIEKYRAIYHLEGEQFFII